MSAKEKDILNKLDFRLYEVEQLKSVNKDVSAAYLTIRDQVIPKLMRNARKNEFYTKPLIRAMDALRKIQGDLVDVSNDIRSKI